MTQYAKYHFVGIGGIGMSALAQILRARGAAVTGSDASPSKTAPLLEKAGIRPAVGHDAANVGDADCVIWSSAIAPDNPEIAAARRAGIPLVHRAELLAECTRGMRSVAVAGMHGKTTTTNMLFHVLRAGGMDPTLISGGIDVALGSNACAGKDDTAVLEADESDGSLVRFHPHSAVLTNLEEEHMGFYKNLNQIRRVFAEFASHVQLPGCVAYSADDKNLKALAVAKKTAGVPFAPFGLKSGAGVSAAEIFLTSRGAGFNAVLGGKKLGAVELQVPGIHNVANALAAITVGLNWDISFGAIREGLAAFRGTMRRLELKAEIGGVRVLDDYAHHPTEVAASLGALMQGRKEGKIFVVFQPHRFSRVHHLAGEFARALAAADEVVLTPVYSAGEANPYAVSSEWIAEGMRRLEHPAMRLAGDFSAIAADLALRAKQGDMIVGMGAGDIEKFAYVMKQALQTNVPAGREAVPC